MFIQYLAFFLAVYLPPTYAAAKTLDSLSFEKFLDTPSVLASTVSPPVVTSHAVLRSLAESVATKHRQIVLSTFLVSPEGPQEVVADLLLNFAQSLRAVDLLQHSLLVGTDSYTAGFVVENGIPCVVDGLMPTLYADARTGAILEGFYPNVSKWLWTQQLVQMDFSVLYLDWDVSVLKNPFDHLDQSYDIQGLSDFRPFGLSQRSKTYRETTGKIHVMLTPTLCAGHSTFSNTNLRKQVAFRDAGHTRTKLHPAACPLYGDSLTPCQSTGVSFIKAGASTQRFLDEFVAELLANTPGWWEQAAYNEFLPAWTMGTGLQAPLRYRLLPYRQFMNVGIWHELGQQSNATEELVVLHGGYVGLTDKGSAFAETGQFHPGSWDPVVGQALIQKLSDIIFSNF